MRHLILVLSFLCIGIGLFIPKVLLVIVVYLIINILYSVGLKNIPVLDIFLVASGFVLRVFAGAMATNVKISSWMFITTLCLALYLACIKRRQEIIKTDSTGRAVLSKYSINLIDRYAEMSATGALIFYSLFAMSQREELIFTIPLVLFGIFRYWYIVEIYKSGESPTDALYSDVPLIVTLLAWGFACMYFLWPH